MESCLSFNDVLIKPKFSNVISRKDIKVETKLCSQKFFPVISANMDSISGPEMTHAMYNYPNLEGPGARGCLHRFWSIEENVFAFKKSANQTWVSFGLGSFELERAKALKDAGADTFILDVAHGANIEVVKQVHNFRDLIGYYPSLVVGNFATAESIQTFQEKLNNKEIVDGYKVAIGGGSACTTRLVSGCGLPTLGSLIDCSRASVSLIADGGMKTSGDIAKALAVNNVKAVMLGGMLAGTKETPGEIIRKVEGTSFITNYNPKWSDEDNKDNWNSYRKAPFEPKIKTYKQYRGSASKESYEVQNKEASWRTPEGESFLVPYKGPVQDILQQIDAGLRSAFSYVGASSLKEFKELAEFISVSQNGFQENGAHGRETK